MRGTTGLAALLLLLISTVSFGTTYFVATPANGGSNSNDGSMMHPFATIQFAIDQTIPGDTVDVTPGTYVGARFFNSGSPGSPITLHGEPGAIVNAAGPQNSNGDNIWVRDTSYIIVEGLEVLNAPRAGIAVQAEPDDEGLNVIVRNNNCHNNGRWGIFTAYAKDLLLEGNETSFSGAEHGIYVSNSSDNPVIRFNISHHNLSSGIQINADPELDGDGIITNAVIDSNIIYENGQPGGGGAAINLASVRNSLIINNLLYDNHKGGLAGWDDGFCDGNPDCGGGWIFGTRDNLIYNNTFVMPSDGRAVISLLNGSINNKIKNNILIHLGIRPSINTDGTSQPGIDSDYNLVKDVFSDDDDTFISLAAWRALGTGHDQHSILYNSGLPLFVDQPGDDYHLIASSQAINIGTPLAESTDDLEGEPRPQDGAFDAGAYEFHDDTCPGDVTDPLTSITSPLDNATVLNTVTINATATDDCSVVKVEFYLDGNLLGTDFTDAYSFDWNTTAAPDGAHILTTIAYDGTGNTGTSSDIHVTIANTDTVDPTTTITSPTEGSQVFGTIAITADADDDRGVTKVEFYLDNVLLNTDTTAPYSFNWNTTTSADGAHVLRSRAYDAAGNTGDSLDVNVTIMNNDTIDPTTSITSPADNSQVSGTITIAADANDDHAVTKVEFYVDGNLIGTDTTSAYSFDWNTLSVAVGAHVLKTIAYDGAGNTGTSADIHVTTTNTFIFFDDFEDNDVSDWTFLKGTWSVSGGILTGTFKKKTDATSPDFGGCTNCTIETDITMTTVGSKVSLLAWWVDKKNGVEISFLSKKGKVIFYQKSGGHGVKRKINQALSIGVNYHVLVSYNGTDFSLSLNGTPIATITAVGTPNGLVGYRVKKGTSTFAQIAVY